MRRAKEPHQDVCERHHTHTARPRTASGLSANCGNSSAPSPSSCTVECPTWSPTRAASRKSTTLGTRGDTRCACDVQSTPCARAQRTATEGATNPSFDFNTFEAQTNRVQRCAPAHQQRPPLLHHAPNRPTRSTVARNRQGRSRTYHAHELRQGHAARVNSNPDRAARADVAGLPRALEAYWQQQVAFARLDGLHASQHTRIRRKSSPCKKQMQMHIHA